MPLAVWAYEILDGMVGICELLDHGDPARPYSSALRAQQEKLVDVERTPSARLLRELTTSGEDFYTLARRMSGLHKEYILALPIPNEDGLRSSRARRANHSSRQRQLKRARPERSRNTSLRGSRGFEKVSKGLRTTIARSPDHRAPYWCATCSDELWQGCDVTGFTLGSPWHERCNQDIQSLDRT
ncbi:MAG: hypothetical protein WDO12_08075 [Pseudomonadota bacterium]